MLEEQLAPYDNLDGVERPASLEQRLVELKAAHSSVLSTYEDLRIAEVQSLSNVIVDEEASPPTEPVQPRTSLNTVLAFTGGG